MKKKIEKSNKAKSILNNVIDPAASLINNIGGAILTILSVIAIFTPKK